MQASQIGLKSNITYTTLAVDAWQASGWIMATPTLRKLDPGLPLCCMAKADPLPWFLALIYKN